MANPTDISLHDLEEETATGTGTSVDLGETRSAVALVLVCAEIEAGATLVITLRTSPDDATWRDHSVLATVETTGRSKHYAAELDQYVQLSWTLDGDCTFRLLGEAYTVYSDQDDLLSALTQDVFDAVPEWVRIKALIDASSIIETVIGKAHDLPLTVWERSLRKRCEQIAARYVQDHHLIHGGGEDANVTRNHAEALEWIKGIGDGNLQQPNTTPAEELGPQFVSGDSEDPDADVPSFAQDFQRGAF